MVSFIRSVSIGVEGLVVLTVAAAIEFDDSNGSPTVDSGGFAPYEVVSALLTVGVICRVGSSCRSVFVAVDWCLQP